MQRVCVDGAVAATVCGTAEDSPLDQSPAGPEAAASASAAVSSGHKHNTADVSACNM